ncbi:DUF397 domain-containing protein [Streptantibioticus rubrisoli]|uniref:DUF397 domain-containing protein n=1 Tax=Streptantibioticus rubrisoli TaxID=1387313 RepID=A0ABT1P9E2_9ACTN|nr:DUF397 domain-containing protein [Streptantibioticus rubrisoli]MCQ4041997.1 DUF397 domain-containing protein [Streptantibioticus rubrisoli]
MALRTKDHVTRTHHGAQFRFSSYTDRGCVGVATPDGGTVAVLDSKDPHGPILEFSHPEWTSFIELAKTLEV